MTGNTATKTATTRVCVASTFTAIHGSGVLEFDCDVTKTTIADVKRTIHQHCHYTSATACAQQSIWWQGYILDDCEQTVRNACVGVNPDETTIMMDGGAPPATLQLFMTIPLTQRLNADATADEEKQKRQRARFPSFDYTLDELKQLFER